MEDKMVGEGKRLEGEGKERWWIQGKGEGRVTSRGDAGLWLMSKGKAKREVFFMGFVEHSGKVEQSCDN
ncbi:hypothetical protein VNO78_03020 [Psophocarpus tetragonolobus]|uniref:Uncharacterized protein n=1 Tax=Psophocarpus tetragonolobus TaxID=3891 RepID=A0AAN9XV79_PSOTE